MGCPTCLDLRFRFARAESCLAAAYGNTLYGDKGADAALEAEVAATFEIDEVRTAIVIHRKVSHWSPGPQNPVGLEN
jgi:hypothetical protein